MLTTSLQGRKKNIRFLTSIFLTELQRNERKSFALPKKINEKKLQLAEIINGLFRNIMKGNLFLSIFYFKHNVSTISWKICVRGIIPLKPKPGIALISTHQNKTSLDLVLITEKCFPLHIPNWENRKGRWKHFLQCIGQPVCTHHGGLAWLR